MAPLGDKSSLYFFSSCIGYSFVVVLHYVVFLLELINELAEVWHLQLEVIGFVRFLIGQVVVLIWLIQNSWHCHMPVVAVETKLHVAQLINEDGPDIRRHCLKDAHAKVTRQVI